MPFSYVQAILVFLLVCHFLYFMFHYLMNFNKTQYRISVLHIIMQIPFVLISVYWNPALCKGKKRISFINLLNIYMLQAKYEITLCTPCLKASNKM
jgi:hypothetical protein